MTILMLAFCLKTFFAENVDLSILLFPSGYVVFNKETSMADLGYGIDFYGC